MIENKTVTGVVDQWGDYLTISEDVALFGYPITKAVEETPKGIWDRVLEDLRNGDCYYFRDEELAVVEKFDKQLAQLLRAHRASEDAIDAYYEARVEGRHP